MTNLVTSVSDRIKHATFTMLFKVVREKASQYLINILLDLNSARNYILWHNSNLRVLFAGSKPTRSLSLLGISVFTMI